MRGPPGRTRGTPSPPIRHGAGAPRRCRRSCGARSRTRRRRCRCARLRSGRRAGPSRRSPSRAARVSDGRRLGAATRASPRSPAAAGGGRGGSRAPGTGPGTRGPPARGRGGGRWGGADRWLRRSAPDGERLPRPHPGSRRRGPACRPPSAAVPASEPCAQYGTDVHIVELLWTTRRRSCDHRGMTAEPRTLAEKVWERHVVHRAEGEPDLLYVDLHLIHEVTSPQAFDGLRLSGRPVRRPDLTVATMDHNVPTAPGAQDPVSVRQMEAMARNAEEFGVTLFPTGHIGQGIVHVIGPQMGLTQPGLVIACGDSHTSTHGAFGALAFGIGTSEVEHVLATQTLPQRRPGTMAITVEGDLPAGVSAKDVILAIIARIGTGGGVGHVLEYRGSAIRSLSMEGRMTVCNMSIEAGARAGVLAPDDTTFAWLEGRPNAPTGADWKAALLDWRSLPTDEGATFDREVMIDAATLRPHVSWGTNPGQTVSIDDIVPEPADEAAERALVYMDLRPGTAIRDIRPDTVFIGSCTNSRITDLREAAEILRGRTVVPGLRAMVVPGSMLVKGQAEEGGLGPGFTAAGFEWRDAGCSMCLGMNPDQLAPGERSASTSNRNFEGRQGKGGRTHLVSPVVAAATAVAGHFATPEDLG